MRALSLRDRAGAARSAWCARAATLRFLIGAAYALLVVGVVGCVQPVSRRWHPPDLVQAPRVSSIALLTAMHPSDSVMALADSTLPALVDSACPGVPLSKPQETEARLAARGVIVPRRFSEAFARQAREVLQVDLLLVPTVVGFVSDQRQTFGAALASFSGDEADEKAGISLDGWDLRSGQRAVHVTRKHSSRSSWGADGLFLFVQATREAISIFADICRQDVSAAPVLQR